MLITWSLGLIVTSSVGVHGISIPFKRLLVPFEQTAARYSGKLSSRDPYGFENVRDNIYTADVFVAGENFTLQLDTGSSDLWIDPAVAGVRSLQNTQDTDADAGICYLDTTCAQGPVLLGNVTLGNLTVPSQAFINAIGSNATYVGMNGLLGLGSTAIAASSIMLDLQNSPVNSNTFLYNLMNTYPSLGNFMSFLLSRSETGDADGGIFTIGEIASGMDGVQQMPQLPILIGDRWAMAVNGMIINGVPMIAPSTTLTPGLATGQLLMNLDTGTARAAVPNVFVDAMYKNQPGAVFDGVSKYTLPCNIEVDVSIVIGNETYPIHPIDVVVIADKGENSRTDSSEWICVGAFDYLEPGSTDVDMVLGDTFMRNVYTVYNLGNWTRTRDSPPSVQLLSTTNAADASAEYASLNNARMAARKGQQLQPARNANRTTRSVPFIYPIPHTLLFATLLCIYHHLF